MTEQDLMNRIQVALSRMALVHRANAGTFQGPGGTWVKGAAPGTADLLCCVTGGRFVALEVKTDKGQQTEQQRKYQAAVERKGGVYAVVRSVEDAIVVVGREVKR